MKWDNSDMPQTLEPCGTYDAYVKNAEERTSQAGNPYINLELDVQGVTFFDNIMPKWPQKLCHFCRSANLHDKWESQNLEAADCIGRDVQVVLSEHRYDNKGNVNPDGWLRIEDYSYDETAVPEKPKPKKRGRPKKKQESVMTTQLMTDDFPSSEAPPNDDIPF